MGLAIQLDGRTAVVTGGANGIGREICNVLRQAGARAIAVDIAVSGIDTRDGAEAVPMDVTEPTTIRDAFRVIRNQFGEPDLLVNNAGAASRVHGMPFTNQSLDEWKRVVSINAYGTVEVTREWIANRPTNRPGVVVNVVSVAAKAPTQTDPAYSAAKATTLAFTRSLARDLAPHVRVCAVCPGMVLTPFYRDQYVLTSLHDQSVSDQTAEEFFAAKAKALIPLGRGQEPVDVAHAVAFLASDLAANITGQALNVDGGLVMS